MYASVGMNKPTDDFLNQGNTHTLLCEQVTQAKFLTHADQHEKTQLLQTVFRNASYSNMILQFDLHFTEACSYGSKRQRIGIDSCDGLSLNRQQVITGLDKSSGASMRSYILGESVVHIHTMERSLLNTVLTFVNVAAISRSPTQNAYYTVVYRDFVVIDYFEFRFADQTQFCQIPDEISPGAPFINMV